MESTATIEPTATMPCVDSASASNRPPLAVSNEHKRRRSRSRSRSRSQPRHRARSRRSSSPTSERSASSSAHRLRPERGRTSAGAPSGLAPPATVLLRHRVLPLAAFAAELRAKIKLSKLDRRESYGSDVIPIAVPLAPGESRYTYERRFQQWLRDRKVSLDHLRDKPCEERSLRISFAAIQADASEKTAENAPRAAPLLPQDSRVNGTRSSASSSAAAAGALLACGCRDCLIRAMRVVAAQVLNGSPTACIHPRVDEPLEHTSAVAQKQAASIVGLVLAKPDLAELTASVDAMAKRDSVEIVHDAVEYQLQRDYDTINDPLVLNEKVLHASADQLCASVPESDLAEQIVLHDENQEFREIVQHEYNTRRAALALLVVYLWRHDRDTLDAMVHDTQAADSTRVQRGIHAKCAALSKAMGDETRALQTLQTELDELVTTTPSFGRDRWQRLRDASECLLHAERQVRDLKTQRKLELATLIHFDKRLRLVVQALLSKDRLASALAS